MLREMTEAQYTRLDSNPLTPQLTPIHILQSISFDVLVSSEVNLTLAAHRTEAFG